MVSSKTINAGKPFFQRFFIRILLGISIAAFLLRLGVAGEFSVINGGSNNMLAPPVVSDLHTYIKLGSEIAQGKFPKEFYYQPFYYSVFLPLIYLASGFSLWAVAVCQALLGGATVFLAGLSAKELFGRSAGLAAAVLTAISTPLLLYAPFHQNETLQCFNLTLLFYLLIRAMRKKTLLLWSGVAVTAGVATLTRGNILLFTPLLLAALWMMKGKNIREKLLFSLVVSLLFLAVQLPFIVRNTLARGVLTGPSTAADAVLALGNTPESPPGGRNAGLPAGPMEYPQSFHDFMAKTAKGISVPRQMWDWMCREPLAFFELQFRKLLLFWDHRELPNNVSLYGEGQHSLLLKLLIPGRSGVLLACALAGMFLFAGGMLRFKRRLFLYGFILIYWGAIAVFYILSRFRAPILPLTAIFGGAFIALLLLRWKKWQPLPKRLALLALVAGTFITVGAYDMYGNNLEPAMMRLCRPSGTLTEHAVLDNGPFTCGGWETAALVPGSKIGKRFDTKHAAGKLKWQLFTPGGLLVCRINGKEQSVFLDPQKPFAEFEVPHVFEIEIVSVPENTFAVFDRRRDYGRSSFNSEPLAGEWVMRFSF